MSTALFKTLAATLADPLAGIDVRDAPIGHVGFDIPLDVLLASGRPFCHLPWVPGRATPLADRWLESAFPGWARSILEDWLRGAFDCFHSVVFTRGDDASQRLYYYLCELQRRGLAAGPRPLIFDVAMIRRPSSLQHCERAIRTLLAQLDVDLSALGSGMARANHQRELFAALAAVRAAPGHVYENIARASLFRDLSPVLDGVTLEAAAPARRLLLAGSVPPDDRFHRAVEAIGWNVVAEALQLTITRHGAPLGDHHAAPLAALAQHCNAAQGGSRDFADRAANLVGAARSAQAAAVVLWLTEEDEALAWHIARQRAALSAAGIPHLVLIRQRWDGSDDAAGAMCRYLQQLDLDLKSQELSVKELSA
jgi:hypothetical protein